MLTSVNIILNGSTYVDYVIIVSTVGSQDYLCKITEHHCYLNEVWLLIYIDFSRIEAFWKILDERVRII